MPFRDTFWNIPHRAELLLGLFTVAGIVSLSAVKDIALVSVEVLD